MNRWHLSDEWRGVVAALFCLCVAFVTSRVQAAPGQPQKVDFPVQGVNLTSPPEATGFTPILPVAPGDIARWGRSDSQGAPAAVIVAELQPVQGHTLEEFAGTLAKQFGGRVEATKERLSGERLLVVTPAPGPVAVAGPGAGAGPVGPGELAPQRVLTAQRGPYFYALGLYATSDQAPDERALEAVRAGWAWRALEPCENHLDLMAEKVPLPGDKLWVEPIGLLRPTGPASDTHAEYTLMDYAAGHPTLAVIAEEMPDRQPGHEQADLKNIEAGVSQTLKLTPALTWTALPGGKTPGWISSLVLAEPLKAARPEDGAVMVRYALVPTPGGRVVFFTFQVTPQAKPIEEKYDKAITAMMATLEVRK